MLNRGVLLCGIVLWLLYAGISSAEVLRPFSSAEQQARYERLVAELRCPKCQNQNLADSNAAIAEDMREKTYQLVLEGRSDEEIVAYFVARYGDFVTFRPPAHGIGFWVWLAPLLVMLIAVGVFVFRVARAGAASEMPSASDSNLSPESLQAEVDALKRRLGGK